MSSKSITTLTDSQTDYISSICRAATKYAISEAPKCIISHEFGNTWSGRLINIESNRFYLHNFKERYFELDCMDVHKDSITFQFSLTNKFFKEII